MDSEPSDARASRILVLDVGLATPGPSRALLPSRQVRGLINSVIHASSSHSAAADQDGDAADSSVAPQQPADEAQEEIVPWLINNRYYSAAVHFAPRSIPLFAKSGEGSSSRRAGALGASAQAAPPESVPPSQPHTEGADDDADAQLKQKSRDIFAALAAPSRPVDSASVGKKALSYNDAAVEALEEELRGVDAVLLLVGRDTPLSAHIALLEAVTGDASPSTEASGPTRLINADELSVALVLGLPSALGASGPTLSSSDAHALEALYLEHGWEYLDLGAALDASAEDDDAGDDEAGEAEDDGLPRAREALQTHMWPNMQRKDDERRVLQPEEPRSERVTSFTSFSAAQEAEDSDEDDVAEDESAEIERRAEAFLASLPLPNSQHAASVDAATERDEELARAFLAQLELSSLANAAGSDMSARELELFLQQSDPHWPSESAAPSNGAGTSASASRFDDDFSDFVSAGDLSTGAAGDSGPSFDDAELEHLQEPGELRGFTAALAEMQREAARIRALPDAEHRHREAERVALAFGEALDRGM